MEYITLFALQMQLSFVLGGNLAEKRIRYLNTAIGLLFFYFFTVGVRYTTDWNVYERAFDGNDIHFKDVLIQQISALVHTLGGSYEMVYVTHILIIGFLCSLFAFKLSGNPFLILTCFLALLFVPLVNQIRYYLSFSLFLVSMYAAFVSKRYAVSLLAAMLAYTSHSGSVILFLFPVVKWLMEKHWSLLLPVSLVVLAGTILLRNNLEEVSHYNIYLAKEALSSFAGGLFKAVPYLLIMSLLYIHSRKIMALNPSLRFDRRFKFLQALSFFPLIFIPSSFLVQITGDRYIFSFCLVWLCFFSYLSGHLQNKSLLLLSRLKFIVVYAVIYCWINFLPDLVFRKSFMKTEMIKSIGSIEYLNKQS